MMVLVRLLFSSRAATCNASRCYEAAESMWGYAGDLMWIRRQPRGIDDSVFAPAGLLCSKTAQGRNRFGGVCDGVGGGCVLFKILRILGCEPLAHGMRL
jgi:hypothetical protein